MLKNNGVYHDENGKYQWSKDPAHNRFERERAELNAEHSKALVSLQGQLSANKSELATTKSELSSAKEEAGKLAAARSPAAQKVQEATAAAAASAAEAKAATAAAVAANGRASRAEKALDAMAKELADSRQALEGVGSRVEQQAQLRGMRIELEHARQKVKEHQSLHISDSKKIAKLTSQAAAEQVQQERAAGTPRQLDAANAAREAAERKLLECKQMMAAAALPPAATPLPRPPSPTSVMADEVLGRGARDCSGRQQGVYAEDWGDRMPSRAETSADLFVRVRPLHRGPKSPYDPAIAELIRRFVSETKIAKQNVAAALALAYTIHTGEVPADYNLVHEKLVDAAFDKLGALDMEVRAKANKVRKHGVAIAGDTGNRKHCAQFKGAMEVMVACVWEDGVGPVAEPLACKDLGNDQSALQGSLAYRAAFDRAGFTPSMLLQAETDNTDHAQLGMRNFIADVLKGVPPERRRALVENCYRHLAVLEEQGAMAAAFPNDEIVNYLRMFYEVWHAQPEYYREVWLQCGNPLNVWEALMRMPEPTSAKWQVSASHPIPRYRSTAQRHSSSASKWRRARKGSRTACSRSSHGRSYIGCAARAMCPGRKTLALIPTGSSGRLCLRSSLLLTAWQASTSTWTFGLSLGRVTSSAWHARVLETLLPLATAMRWRCVSARMQYGTAPLGLTQPLSFSRQSSSLQATTGAALSIASQRRRVRTCASEWPQHSRKLRPPTSSGVQMCGGARGISTVPCAMRNIAQAAPSKSSLHWAMGRSWARLWRMLAVPVAMVEVVAVVAVAVAVAVVEVVEVMVMVGGMGWE